MKLPNKLYTTKESCIGKFPVLLQIIKEQNMSILNLYIKMKKQFDSITDFTDTLEALFYLNKIEYDNEKGEVFYVD